MTTKYHVVILFLVCQRFFKYGISLNSIVNFSDFILVAN